jgi:hypothetical protein
LNLSHRVWLAIALALGCGCADGQQGVEDASALGDLSSPHGDFDLASADFADTDGPIVTTGSNVVPMIVDTGPAGNGYNTPYISIKLCAPGSTSNCTTIDHIEVDTGSVGLRIISSAIVASSATGAAVLSALPNAQASGQNLTECFIFGDGFVYGSVRTGDVSIGGESVAGTPFVVMGDPTYGGDIPSSCYDSGTEEDTVASFGANGIIGMDLFNPDCGADCTGTSQSNPIYYGCPSATTCAEIAVPVAAQVPNLVAKLASDNNGLVLELPAIGVAGAGTTTGSLTFGIGTRANNALGSATVYQATNGASKGTVTTQYDGVSYTNAYFDSGTSDLSFPNGAIADCTGALAGFDCPTMTQHLTATIIDVADTMGTVSFTVANASTTLAFETTTNCAFDDLADTGSGSTSFAWGLPFFFGRKVFFAIDGASTPGGAGPYYAF